MVLQVQQLPSYPLLRVTKEATLQPYGFTGRESHSIPLVPAIAEALYPRQQVLLITPPLGEVDITTIVTAKHCQINSDCCPAGLLDWIRHTLLLSYLRM
jgi:hypothetical protein